MGSQRGKETQEATALESREPPAWELTAGDRDLPHQVPATLGLSQHLPHTELSKPVLPISQPRSLLHRNQVKGVIKISTEGKRKKNKTNQKKKK